MIQDCGHYFHRFISGPDVSTQIDLHVRVAVLIYVLLSFFLS